jgi:hypothetical protein
MLFYFAHFAVGDMDGKSSGSQLPRSPKTGHVRSSAHTSGLRFSRDTSIRYASDVCKKEQTPGPWFTILNWETVLCPCGKYVWKA